MTRLRKRLARLEGSKGNSLIIFAVDRYEEDGPFVGTAWGNGVHYRRHDGESEEDFRLRVEQCARLHLHPRANGKPR